MPLFLRLIIVLMTASSSWGSAVVANQAIERYEAKRTLWEQSQRAGSSQSPVSLPQPDLRNVYQKVTRELARDLKNPLSLRALSWLYQEASFLLEKNPKVQSVLLSAVERYHYKLPGAGELALVMSGRGGPREIKVIEKIAVQNPSKVDRGLANIALSTALAQLGDEVEIIAKRLKYLKQAIELVPADTELGGRRASDVIGDQVYVIMNLTKGRKAPALAGTTLSGQEVSLADYPGKAKALLFWDAQDAQAETFLSVMRDTQKLAESSGAVLIGIYTGDPSELHAWTAERAVTWPNLIDRDRSLTRSYRIATTPTLFLLSKGNLVQGHYAPGSLANLTLRALASEEE